MAMSVTAENEVNERNVEFFATSRLKVQKLQTYAYRTALAYRRGIKQALCA